MKPVRSRVKTIVRKHHRQAVKMSRQTDRSIERNVFGRIEKFKRVRRFVIGWLVLFSLLIVSVLLQNSALSGYYQTEQPIAGGIFREGIVGTFTNANPIYATSDVDMAVSELIFAGLFKHDGHNKLVGDLAESWSVDSTGRIYTIKLRPNLVWQDGTPLTAQDVAFTYNVIQNPDAESPLRANWAGITTEATDKRTVIFTLPNPLGSFVYNLTNGIVPAHLLKDIPMTGLRSVAFNTQSPIGAGPFRWHDIQISGLTPSDAQARIGLVPFEQYWAGQPKLRTFIVNSFASKQDMIDAYKDNQLNAMAGLDQLPADIGRATQENSYSFTLTAANMVFFHTKNEVLKDKAVRQALVLGTNPEAIIGQLSYLAPRVRAPILASQFAYDKRYVQVTGQSEKAAKQLDKAGWRVQQDGIRAKKNKRLSFRLVAADTAEQRMVTAQLKRQWKSLGVEVVVRLQDTDTFHNSLVNREYDAVVYGITIGADPDVFVYWDSSQNDARAANRLNLSEYNSSVADLALEAGRTRTEQALRKAKYQTFLKTWQKDAPALGLYQPRFLYVSRAPIYGLEQRMLNVGNERYDNVHNWMIRTAKVTIDK